MNKDYDRYEIYRNSDGTVDQLPFINLPFNNTDKYETWYEGRSKLEYIAKKYYNNPFFDFLLLLANPQYLSEYDIPDGEVIRIPFPLEKAKEDYEALLSAYRKSKKK